MPTKITVKNNSALIIEGDFEIYDGQGKKIDTGGKTTISLCRCGRSERKPFCDGKHKECGFSSQVLAE